MIESVHFRNLKVLRNATLPFSPLTVLVGPNGSGKSTALTALQAVAGRSLLDVPNVFSVDSTPPAMAQQQVVIDVEWGPPHEGFITRAVFQGGQPNRWHFRKDKPSDAVTKPELDALLAGFRHFSFSAAAIACPVQLQPQVELAENGSALPVVLDRMRDHDPERFEALNVELGRWLPEFDRILFDTPSAGYRSIRLRLKGSPNSIPAAQLSEGTLLSLALMTLAYLANPPTLVSIEEPERGIHPRLLRRVQDALFRLVFPSDFGEQRSQVQVIVATHAPYFLDLFRDRIDLVVIAERNGMEATFDRLSDRPDIHQILHGEPLGEIWYTGILGGVPAGT